MATSRSIQPSSNPYASGAIVLDSSPYTQFALNKQAREEANYNAFLKSFQDLGNNINAAGLHQSDVPDVLTNKAKWQQYVMAHPKEYNNPSLDNGKAYGEASKLYNESLAHVSQAKQKVLNLAEHAKVLQDPTKAGLLSEADHPNYEKALLPVSTAGQSNGYQPWVPDYTPKAFDELKYRNEISPLSQKIKVGTKLENDQNYQTNFRQTPVTEYTHNYDKDQLALVAENKYAQDRSYRDLIKKIGENPVQYQIYNDIYKKEFGKNLDIQHPEQVAIAHTLSLVPKNFTEKGEPKIDQAAFDAAKYARAEADRRTRQQRSFDHQDKLAEIGADVIPQIFQGYKTGVPFEGKEGQNVEQLNIPPIIANKFKVSEQVPADPIQATLAAAGKPFKSKKVETVPSFGLGQDGKIYAIQFQKDDKGNLTKTPDWSKSKEVPQSEIIAEIQNHAVPSNSKAKTMLKTLGQKLGIGTKPVVVKKGVLD